MKNLGNAEPLRLNWIRPRDADQRGSPEAQLKLQLI